MSQQKDDMDEFNETVGKTVGKSAPDRGANKIRRFAPGDLLDDTDDEPASTPGKLCQYSLFRTGYLPTTATVRKLKAGCYKVQASEAGVWLDVVTITTDDLIQFPDTKSDSVIAEVEKFWTLKDKFKQFGFSHKRGYLLWGPPGSGKTCTVAVIIKKMIEKGGCVILAESPDWLAHILPRIRSVESDRPLAIIWEDIDAIIDKYGESQVLSVLDGESQVDNIVFIATTNYPEKLDGRITNRPSRFDRIEKIGMPSAEARSIYLTKKLGTTIGPDGSDLVKATDGLSIAHLRELIVGIYCQELPVGGVIERLKKMKVQPNSASNGGPLGLS